MQPPNRLGSVLTYFSDAYAHAFVRKVDPRRLSYSFLSDMANTAKYRDYKETVDTEEAMKLAITSSWVYSGIKLIADRVASADARFAVKKRVGEEFQDIRNHPFEILCHQPNSLMTMDFILRYITFWAFLRGNAYIFVSTPFPGMGQPEELWPLPSNRVSPIPTSLRTSKLTGKPCIDYLYKVDDTKDQILPGENVIHIRFANIFDYWQGLSPLTAMMDAIRLDRYQLKFMQGFFGKDNAVPTAIISVPQETNDIDFEVIKQQIRDQFGEGRRSAITRAGDFDVKVITHTMREMEIANSRKFSREEINHVLGIPEGLVSGGQSGDSRLATEITFVRNTVQPYLDMLASEFSAAIGLYYGQNIVISAPNIIPQDRALKVTEYQQYSQDRTINENRQELHLPALDIISVMMEINALREAASLEPITAPLNDVMMDVMLRMPVRLLPMISSNTFANAGGTGLSPGQIDANGEEVEDPMAQFEEAAPEDDGSAPPSFANVEVPPDVPDLPGLQGPTNEQQKQSGRSIPTHQLAAIKIGQREELYRWKKVAMKCARDGQNPAERTFETDVLPTSLHTRITKQLEATNEQSCALVFDTIIATLESVEGVV